jgi:hypothetical protein
VHPLKSSLLGPGLYLQFGGLAGAPLLRLHLGAQHRCEAGWVLDSVCDGRVACAQERQGAWVGQQLPPHLLRVRPQPRRRRRRWCSARRERPSVPRHTHTQTQTHRGVSICTHTYTHVSAQAHTHRRTHTQTHTHTDAHTHTCTNPYVHTHTHVYRRERTGTGQLWCHATHAHNAARRTVQRQGRQRQRRPGQALCGRGPCRYRGRPGRAAEHPRRPAARSR